MSLRSIMRRLRRKRFIKSGIVLATGLMVLTQYQNCTPIGDAYGVGDNASLSFVPGTNCALAPAPVLNGAGPGAVTARVGLGTGSGNQFPAQFEIPVIKGYVAQAINTNCNIQAPLNNSMQVNCNYNQNSGMLRVTLSNRNNSECVTGSATVNLRVRDDICRDEAQSNVVAVTLNAVNSCPAQQVISKDQMNPERQDQFGSRVAISGNIAVVTAVSDNERASNAGAAFVYKNEGGTWTFQQKLIPSDAAADSQIDAVAISGNLLVLGAPFHGTKGRAWVYQYNGTTWNEIAGIDPSLQNTSNGTQDFGFHVAISGSTVVVGSPGYNYGDSASFARAGAVFVYSVSGSSVNQVRVLSASDKALGARFGEAVATDGTSVVVGAPDAGKAYSYNIGSGAETALVGGLNAGSLFGSSVDISGGRVAIGAPAAVNGANGVGAVVTFEGATKKDTLFGTENGAQYGFAVALNGNDLLVGAPTQDINGSTNGGAAHLLRHDGSGFKPYFIYRPRAADQGNEDYFGESVDLNGSVVLVGARADDRADTDMGSAVFIGIP